MKKYIKQDSGNTSTEPVKTPSLQIPIPISPKKGRSKLELQSPKQLFYPVLESLPTTTSLNREFSSQSECPLKVENSEVKTPQLPPFSFPMEQMQQTTQIPNNNCNSEMDLYQMMMQSTYLLQCLQFQNQQMMLPNPLLPPFLSDPTMQMFQAMKMFNPKQQNDANESQTSQKMPFDMFGMPVYEMQKEGNDSKRKRRGNITNNNREETKNLLKIYSLGFHKYIDHTYQEIFGVSKQEIMGYLQNNRLESYTLKGLRKMWEKNDNESPEVQKYNKIIRIYCKKFLQTEALSYFLTHSRTKNPYIILKYRSVLLQFLYEPQNLRYLKLRDKENFLIDDCFDCDSRSPGASPLKKFRKKSISNKTSKPSSPKNSVDLCDTPTKIRKLNEQQTLDSSEMETERI